MMTPLCLGVAVILGGGSLAAGGLELPPPGALGALAHLVVCAVDDGDRSSATGYNRVAWSAGDCTARLDESCTGALSWAESGGIGEDWKVHSMGDSDVGGVQFPDGGISWWNAGATARGVHARAAYLCPLPSVPAFPPPRLAVIDEVIVCTHVAPFPHANGGTYAMSWPPGACERPLGTALAPWCVGVLSWGAASGLDHAWRVYSPGESDEKGNVYPVGGMSWSMYDEAGAGLGVRAVYYCPLPPTPDALGARFGALTRIVRCEVVDLEFLNVQGRVITLDWRSGACDGPLAPACVGALGRAAASGIDQDWRVFSPGERDGTHEFPTGGLSWWTTREAGRGIGVRAAYACPLDLPGT